MAFTMSECLESSFLLADEAATLAAGRAFALKATAPLVVYLLGDLGAGKTTFARGILQQLGHQGAVKSPTYSIVESYRLSDFTLHHFDLYRFVTPEEWLDAGLDDLFGEHTLALIEWPQQAEGFVPPADLSITLTHLPEGRCITFTPHTEMGKHSLVQSLVL